MELDGAGGSRAGPAVLYAHGDVVMVDAPPELPLPVASPPDDGVVRSGPLPPAIVVEQGGSSSRAAPAMEIAAAVGSSSLMGARDGGEGVAVAAAAGLQLTAMGNDRFVPIRDVKTMLQSGQLEGMQIVYRNKRAKLNLLYGVIHGMSYFCSCSDCDHIGKALSARAFEQHAVGKGNESNSANDHIFLCLSNISLFDACRRLKEATNEAMLETIFDTIKKGGPNVSKNKMTISAKDTFVETADNNELADPNVIQSVRELDKRMESAQMGLEKLQVQVNTIDNQTDFLCKEMGRYQELFQDISKVMGKFFE
ncbi:hypothetical protein ACP4OV_015031 [Aristida adscensionis]